MAGLKKVIRWARLELCRECRVLLLALFSGDRMEEERRSMEVEF
jgi:hypothetical protein